MTTTFGRKRTAIYGRNTVHIKCFIYGTDTVVIILVPIVSVSVNDCVRSFTVFVMLDLGSFDRRYNRQSSSPFFFE